MSKWIIYSWVLNVSRISRCTFYVFFPNLGFNTVYKIYIYICGEWLIAGKTGIGMNNEATSKSYWVGSGYLWRQVSISCIALDHSVSVPGLLWLKQWNVSNYNINKDLNVYSPFLSFLDFLVAPFNLQMIQLCFFLDKSGLRDISQGGWRCRKGFGIFTVRKISPLFLSPVSPRCA